MMVALARSAALLLLAASPIAVAQPQLARTVDLRPRWQQGAESRLVLTLDQNNTVSGQLGLGDSEQVVKQEITLRERVIKADPEKGATVELIYERVKVKLDSDAGSVDYDSDKPEGGGKPKPQRKNDGLDFLDDMVAQSIEPYLKRVAGTKLTVTIDGDGKITSVEGGESLTVPGLGGPVGGLKPSADGLSPLFGPITTMQQGQASRVKVGDTWTHSDTFDLQPLGGLKMVTKHALKSIDGGGSEATVTFMGHIEPGTASPTAPLAIKVANYSGSYIWDARAGRLKSMTGDQETQIETNTVGGASMKSKGKMNVKRETGYLPPLKPKP